MAADDGASRADRSPILETRLAEPRAIVEARSRLDGGAVVGCLDVGRAGVADRYQDLALLWRGLGELGVDLQQHLLASYGPALPDEPKLRFHLLLDELL